MGVSFGVIRGERGDAPQHHAHGHDAGLCGQEGGAAIVGYVCGCRVAGTAFVGELLGCDGTVVCWLSIEEY